MICFFSCSVILQPAYTLQSPGKGSKNTYTSKPVSPSSKTFIWLM